MGPGPEMAEPGRTGEGVVHAVVVASRTKRDGVMVCASERAEEIESLRWVPGDRIGEWLEERDAVDKEVRDVEECLE